VTGQRGQAMVEYVAVVASICGVLLAPIVPRPDGSWSSILMLFIDSFDIYINSFHTVIGLPVP
jgi:hypothetical protein